VLRQRGREVTQPATQIENACPRLHPGEEKLAAERKVLRRGVRWADRVPDALEVVQAGTAPRTRRDPRSRRGPSSRES
jgi:hypothetical protein